MFSFRFIPPGGQGRSVKVRLYTGELAFASLFESGVKIARGPPRAGEQILGLAQRFEDEDDFRRLFLLVLLLRAQNRGLSQFRHIKREFPQQTQVKGPMKTNRPKVSPRMYE